MRTVLTTLGQREPVLTKQVTISFLPAVVRRYEVNIAPKGLVPTRLVEWRIKEDVPANLKSVKSRIEKVIEGDLYYEPPMSPGKQHALSSLPLVR